MQPIEVPSRNLKLPFTLAQVGGRRFAIEWAFATAYICCVLLVFVNSRSLWFDEAISESIASQPYSAILKILHHVDAVHGLYYSLLHVWMFFGQTAIAIRLLSVVFAIFASFAIGALARSMFSESCAPAAVVILATSGFFLYYAGEARPACLTLMLCSFSTLFFWRAVNHQRAGDILSFGLFSILSLYASIISLLFFAALIVVACMGLVWQHRCLRLTRTTIWLFFGTAIAVIAACIPLVLMIRENSLAQVGWIPRSDAAAIVHFGVSILGGDGRADFGFGGRTGEFKAALVAALMIVGVAGVWRSRATRASVVAALVLLVTPLALGTAIDRFFHPVLIARYFSFMLIPTALLAGNGLSVIRRRSGSVIVCCIIVVLGLISIHRLRGGELEDWRAVSQFVSRNSRPSEAIVFEKPWSVTPFQFATREAAASPEAQIVYPNSPLINVISYPDPSTGFIRTISQQHKRLWLIQSSDGFCQTDRHPFDSLSQYYPHVTRKVFTGLQVVVYSR